MHSPNIVDNWIFCLVKDQETGFSQIVGVEFQESGEFSSKVFNLNNQYWYADASELHCVIRETASDNTMLELIFHGKNVKNYGESRSVLVLDGSSGDCDDVGKDKFLYRISGDAVFGSIGKCREAQCGSKCQKYNSVHVKCWFLGFSSKLCTRR